MSPAAAAFRDKTHRDVLQLRFEAGALIALLLISAAAAATSFFALYWVGTAALGWPAAIAALFPVAIDGLAATASAATVIFVAKSRELRAFAWAVFLLLLAVSLAGNVAHAFHVGHPDVLPRWLFATLAAAPPVIVALGVHLYTLIVRHGVSSRISTTNPDQVIVDPDAFEAGLTTPRRPSTTTRRSSTTGPDPQQLPAAAIATPTDPAIDAQDAQDGAQDDPTAPAGPASPTELVPAAEAAAYAAFRVERLAGHRPTGPQVAQLLFDHRARDRVVTAAQGQKVRARWEQAIDAGVDPITELHLADPPRSLDDDVRDLDPAPDRTAATA